MLIFALNFLFWLFTVFISKNLQYFQNLNQKTFILAGCQQVIICTAGFSASVNEMSQFHVLRRNLLRIA